MPKISKWSKQIFLTMSKFQVLQSNRSFISRLGLITDPRNTLFMRLLTYTFIILAFGFGYITSVILIFENIDDLEFILEAALSIGVPQFIGVYLSVRFNKNKVDELHARLQGIVDKGIDDGFERDSVFIFYRLCFSQVEMVKYPIFTGKMSKDVENSLEHCPISSLLMKLYSHCHSAIQQFAFVLEIMTPRNGFCNSQWRRHLMRKRLSVGISFGAFNLFRVSLMRFAWFHLPRILYAVAFTLSHFAIISERCAVWW